MAIKHQVGTRESIERNPWTSEDWREVLVFLAQSFGLVCVAVFLYSLGPALGMALLVGSLAVWPLFRNQPASEKEKDGLGEKDGHAANVNSPSRRACPIPLRNDRFGVSVLSATHRVQ
jgi:hypothetical protein